MLFNLSFQREVTSSMSIGPYWYLGASVDIMGKFLSCSFIGDADRAMSSPCPHIFVNNYDDTTSTDQPLRRPLRPR